LIASAFTRTRQAEQLDGLYHCGAHQAASSAPDLNALRPDNSPRRILLRGEAFCFS
jgi:hypothetical protein